MIEPRCKHLILHLLRCKIRCNQNLIGICKASFQEDQSNTPGSRRVPFFLAYSGKGSALLRRIYKGKKWFYMYNDC